MGTYREEIYAPYGSHEAVQRITRWLETQGNNYKVIRQTTNEFILKRSMPMNPDIFFKLYLTEDTIHAECWVKGFTKDPISPKALWGAISRRTGWSNFQELKEVLSRDVIPGAI